MPEVFTFTNDKFTELLAEGSFGASTDDINGKKQTQYLKVYLDKIGVKSVVVEKNYIDRAYMEDFAGHYSRCFVEYPRFCTRLHFFSATFDKTEFTDALVGKGQTTPESLQKAYLGFIVVRPLPGKIFGRACLSTYPKTARKRYFPANRSYSANLYGFDLQVSSIAMQEQDSEVSACATSALWSIFHATSKLFQHSLLSPFEITRVAARDHADIKRSIPNQGLNSIQISNAIRSVGLETTSINLRDSSYNVLQNHLKASFYAYSRARIPIVVATELAFDDANQTTFGHHAVAGLGYAFGTTEHGQLSQDGPLIRGAGIDRLYVHDDQVGPFAKLEFSGNKIQTSWPQQNGKPPIIAKPILLIVPLYPKIRTEFYDVYKTISGLDAVIDSIRNITNTLPHRLVWDIYLTEISDLRRSLHVNNKLQDSQKLRALTKGLPKYLWRVSINCGTDLVGDLCFDATDLSVGAKISLSIFYEDPLHDIFKVASTSALKLTPTTKSVLHQSLDEAL